MAKKVQLVAVVPPELLDTFIDEKKITSIDGIPDLSDLVKTTVREFMRKNTGYDNEAIACLSNLNGVPPELSKIWNQVDEVLATKTGSSLWQLAMPEDMIVSIDFQALLDISHETEDMDMDDPMAEIYIQDLMDSLYVGYLEGQSTVSFVPYIELTSCRVAVILDSNWESESLEIPGLKFLTLKKLSVFNWKD